MGQNCVNASVAQKRDQGRLLQKEATTKLTIRTRFGDVKVLNSLSKAFRYKIKYEIQQIKLKQVLCFSFCPSSLVVISRHLNMWRFLLSNMHWLLFQHAHAQRVQVGGTRGNKGADKGGVRRPRRKHIPGERTHRIQCASPEHLCTLFLTFQAFSITSPQGHFREKR